MATNGLYSANVGASNIVVWSWSNDQGNFTAYEPAVSNEIEKNYQNGATYFQGGQIDPALTHYTIDLSNMSQIRQNTGKQRPIKRLILPTSSTLGQGFIWEFEGDNSNWKPYDIDTLSHIESASTCGSVDLAQVNQPYYIDFQRMIQVRKPTGTTRRIRRQQLSHPYLAESSSFSTSYGGNNLMPLKPLLEHGASSSPPLGHNDNNVIHLLQSPGHCSNNTIQMIPPLGQSSNNTIQMIPPLGQNSDNTIQIIPPLGQTGLDVDNTMQAMSHSEQTNLMPLSAKLVHSDDNTLQMSQPSEWTGMMSSNPFAQNSDNTFQTILPLGQTDVMSSNPLAGHSDNNTTQMIPPLGQTGMKSYNSTSGHSGNTTLQAAPPVGHIGMMSTNAGHNVDNAVQSNLPPGQMSMMPLNLTSFYSDDNTIQTSPHYGKANIMSFNLTSGQSGDYAVLSNPPVGQTGMMPFNSSLGYNSSCMMNLSPALGLYGNSTMNLYQPLGHLSNTAKNLNFPPGHVGNGVMLWDPFIGLNGHNNNLMHTIPPSGQYKYTVNFNPAVSLGSTRFLSLNPILGQTDVMSLLNPLSNQNVTHLNVHPLSGYGSRNLSPLVTYSAPNGSSVYTNLPQNNAANANIHPGLAGNTMISSAPISGQPIAIDLSNLSTTNSGNDLSLPNHMPGHTNNFWMPLIQPPGFGGNSFAPGVSVAAQQQVNVKKNSKYNRRHHPFPRRQTSSSRAPPPAGLSTQIVAAPQAFSSGTIPNFMSYFSTPSQNLPASQAQIEPVTESLPTSNEIAIIQNSQSKSTKSGFDVLKKYMKSVSLDLDKNDCPICCSKLSEASSYGDNHPEAHSVVQLSGCGHQFHKLCLLAMYESSHKGNSLQCPGCNTIYGEKMGNCPPGTMKWTINNFSVAGYEGYNTICISYLFTSGNQGEGHPQPGQPYSARGFPRQAYLPDCNKGRKVLKLLIKAFKRRLMFTISTSHTTGEPNTLTWNEIHHKTEHHGNSYGHGYPDPNYLDNVLLELAAHGVTA